MSSNLNSMILKFPPARWVFEKIRYRTRGIYRKNSHLFVGEKGIEVGGPSKVFSNIGPLPFYNVIAGLDNINFSDDNFWSSIGEGNNYEYQTGRPKGKQIIADAIDLSKIEDERYDFMLSSHCIEHLANPLKGLFEWKRIIKKGGHIAIIAPDMRYTYDRKRPLTAFEHIEQDYKQNMQEDDSTHFAEVIELHDMTNDGTVTSYEEHVARTKDNFNTRIVHHHTYDLELVKKMLVYCGFEIVDAEAFRPYHLFVIAKKK